MGGANAHRGGASHTHKVIYALAALTPTSSAKSWAAPEPQSHVAAQLGCACDACAEFPCLLHGSLQSSAQAVGCVLCGGAVEIV